MVPVHSLAASENLELCIIMNHDRTLPYRCMIPNDDSVAIIKAGSSKFDCRLIDVSREDFHIRLPKNKMKRLRRARRIELHYHGERWLVTLDPSDRAIGDAIYLNRVRELTEMKHPSPWRSLVSLQFSKQTDPRFVLTMMVAFIFSCLALPGLGDKIGTAPRLKNGIQYMVKNVTKSGQY